MPEVSSLLSSGNVPREKEGLPLPCFEGVVLVRSEAALLLLLLLDSESELLRGRLQSLTLSRDQHVYLIPHRYRKKGLQAVYHVLLHSLQ